MLNNLDLNAFSFLSYQDVSLFMQKYSGSIFVIKYGGAAMKNNDLRLKVIEDLVFLNSLGIKIVLVHGGGPFINDWLVKLNIKPKFENGIRLTDYHTMQIVEMVLSGQVNKELVSLLGQKNILSVGLSGKDSNLIIASSLFKSFDNFVGKVDKINNQLLNLLLDNNYIPVIASIASDFKNQTYNINADTIAGAIASSIKAEKLILLTDTPGVMLDINDSSTLVKTLTLRLVNELKDKKIIVGGMIPKIECCIDALITSSSISSAHIIDGRVEHALLYETLTLNRLGSMIVLN